MQLAGTYSVANDFNRFNPLFIGSKDATLEKRPERQAHRRVSIPFSSGQRMQLREESPPEAVAVLFQSPFHRVKGCNPGGGKEGGGGFLSFNPLFIGSKDATRNPERGPRRPRNRFNPLFIGSKDATPNRGILGDMFPRFNPLFIGSKDATFSHWHNVVSRNICFNPLFIGSKDATPSFFSSFREKVCFNPLFIGSKDATLIPPSP